MVVGAQFVAALFVVKSMVQYCCHTMLLLPSKSAVWAMMQIVAVPEADAVAALLVKSMPKFWELLAHVINLFFVKVNIVNLACVFMIWDKN